MAHISKLSSDNVVHEQDNLNFKRFDNQRYCADCATFYRISTINQKFNDW